MVHMAKKLFDFLKFIQLSQLSALGEKESHNLQEFKISAESATE